VAWLAACRRRRSALLAAASARKAIGKRGANVALKSETVLCGCYADTYENTFIGFS